MPITQFHRGSSFEGDLHCHFTKRTDNSEYRRDRWSSGRGYAKGPVPGPRRHGISDAVPRRAMRPIIDFYERNNLARGRILHHEIDDLLREGIAVRWRGSLDGPRGRLEKGAHRPLGVKAVHGKELLKHHEHGI